MEQLSKAYEVLTQLSSSKGLKIDKYLLKAKLPLMVKLSSTEDGEIEIDFIDNRPVVTVKKIFTIRIDVLGITLGESEGVVKLDGFPDMPFSYNEEE